MPKQIQIEIPKPCHENWDEMTPEQQGKFCGVCSKTVVDFSLMGDGQILETLKSTTGSICGRFSNDQLERPLVKPLQPKWYMSGMWKYVLSSFMLFKVANVKAQQKPEIVNTNRPVIDDRPMLMGIIARPKIIETNFKGIVVNEAGKPLANAIISVVGTDKTATTDKKGNFSITAKKNHTIEISLFGYETLTTSLKANERNKFVLNISSEPIGRTMGIVAYDYFDKVNTIPNEDLKYIIKDSATGNPIPYAIVEMIYKGHKEHATANDKGELVIKSIKGATIVELNVSAIGYTAINNKQFAINDKQTEIILAPRVKQHEKVEVIGVTMGKVTRTKTVCTTSVTKGQIVKTVKDTVTKNNITKESINQIQNDALTIFPNPLNVGDVLQLQYKSILDETIMFQVSTMEGKIVLLQKEKAQKGINAYQIQIPNNTAPQILVVQLMNSKGKWIASEKVVLQ